MVVIDASPEVESRPLLRRRVDTLHHIPARKDSLSFLSLPLLFTAQARVHSWTGAKGLRRERCGRRVQKETEQSSTSEQEKGLPSGGIEPPTLD
jgi:hypothetical protein